MVDRVGWVDVQRDGKETARRRELSGTDRNGKERNVQVQKGSPEEREEKGREGND